MEAKKCGSKQPVDHQKNKKQSENHKIPRDK